MPYLTPLESAVSSGCFHCASLGLFASKDPRNMPEHSRGTHFQSLFTGIEDYSYICAKSCAKPFSGSRGFENEINLWVWS